MATSIYKGTALGKRRRYSKPGPLATRKAREEWEARERDEEAELVLELFRFHGVEVPDWTGLAIALTRAHVPAMKVERSRRGAPTKWSFFSLAVLRFNVDRYAAEQRVSVERACEHLANREPYVSILRSGGDSKRGQEQALARGAALAASPGQLAVRERARAKQLAEQRGDALRKQYDRCDPRWVELFDTKRSFGFRGAAQGKAAIQTNARTKAVSARKNRERIVSAK